MSTSPLPYILPFLLNRTWYLDFATITPYAPSLTPYSFYHCYASLDLASAFSYDDPNILPRILGPVDLSGRPPAVSLRLFVVALVPTDLSHWHPHISIIEIDLIFDNIYWCLVQRLKHHSNTLITSASPAVFRFGYNPPHSPLFLDIIGDGASSLKSILYSFRALAYGWAVAHSANIISFRTPLLHMSLTTGLTESIPFTFVE